MGRCFPCQSVLKAVLMKVRVFFAVVGIALSCLVVAGIAVALESPARPQAEAQQATETEEEDTQFDAADGFPIDNATLVTNCVRCHAMNDDGYMTRVSYLRKAPEGWQQSVRRMVLLQDVELDPADAREIVKYLANTQGLAPEEAAPGAFEVERRLIDYRYTADEETETTCIQCHSFGRVLIQRRTEQEWNLLMATHRYYYPLVDFQAFIRSGPRSTEPGPDGSPPDNRHPMDKAVAHLSRAFPLDTDAWASWSANMRQPRIAGTWAVSGYEPGKGPIYGHLTITADPPAEDEFTTEAVYTYARTGQQVRRQGRSIVYTGFQWRGRSYEDGDEIGLREIMMVDRDRREVSGRWYTGGYDETGLDVTLRRVTADPLVAGVFPSIIRRGESLLEITIYGANLPASIAAGDLDFGGGIVVTEVVSAGAGAITVRVSAATDADVGGRDLFVAGTSHRDALTVYDKVHAIQITPLAGMARVGGVVFPKGFQQFEAIARSNGADGEAGTDDDLELGAVAVVWSLEEYAAVLDDDDLAFVGGIDDGGLFTPAEDGPNPNRSGERNNIGDVWVVGTFIPNDATGAAGAEELRARAHLLVTVPLYMRWEPWATGGLEGR